MAVSTLQRPWPAIGLALLQFAVLVAIALLVGTRGWDDGAITLAYARTFATTGRIALTPLSEQVEGFSTPAWFLLNAAIAWFRPSFQQAIFASQVLTAACFAATTVMLLLLARKLAIRPLYAWAAALSWAFLGTTLQETANGMEMGLLALSGLAIVYFVYFDWRPLAAALCAVVFLACRFEAMVYYAFLLFPLVIERRYRHFLLLALFGIAVVAGLEVLRLAIFGDILPNTVYAKMHPPYAAAGLKAWAARVFGGIELFRVMPLVTLAILVLVVANAAALLKRVRVDAVWLRNAAILTSPVIGVALFNLMIGWNWGYLGRMEILGLAFLLLLLAFLLDTLVGRLARGGRALLLGGVTVTILMSWGISAPTALAEARATVTGAERGFDVTPQSYRRTAMAVDTVRSEAGLPAITFLTADVGGSALNNETIRIVDIGLLANRTLAHEGYRALPRVLATERPGVIEVHQGWASLSKIYDLPQFRSDYVPALVADTRLFIRADIAASLRDANKASFCPATEPRCRSLALEGHRSTGFVYPADDEAFLRRGGFLLIGG